MSEDLSSLKGIGPKTVQKLLDAGIKTIADVATLRPEELASILGWNRMKALETINDAKEKALDVAIQLLSLKDFEEEINGKICRFSTGSKAIDELIGGGIATNELTGLRGPFATGKTQLCMTSAVFCIKEGRSVAWIETEPGTFKSQRLEEIAENRGVDLDIEDDVFVIPARFILSPNHQFLAYQRVEREINRGTDIGLIVIDSFSPKFREFYPRREMFPQRSQETGRHLGFLQYLAAKYNLAVVLTVQVMGVPDSNKALETQMIEFSDKAMYGGHVLKHSVQTWLSLRIKSKKDRIFEAALFDSSYLPTGSVYFTIGPEGVTDLAAKKGRG